MTNPEDSAEQELLVRVYNISLRMLILEKVMEQLEPMIEIHCNDHQYRSFLELDDAWQEYRKNNNPTIQK